MKIHDLKRVTVDGIVTYYFYKQLKNDRNGNPRYQLLIVDHDTLAVYEKTCVTYDIEGTVKRFITEGR